MLPLSGHSTELRWAENYWKLFNFQPLTVIFLVESPTFQCWSPHLSQLLSPRVISLWEENLLNQVCSETKIKWNAVNCKHFLLDLQVCYEVMHLFSMITHIGEIFFLALASWTRQWIKLEGFTIILSVLLLIILNIIKIW